jgi:hypothetical protein
VQIGTNGFERAPRRGKPTRSKRQRVMLYSPYGSTALQGIQQGQARGRQSGQVGQGSTRPSAHTTRTPYRTSLAPKGRGRGGRQGATCTTSMVCDREGARGDT